MNQLNAIFNGTIGKNSLHQNIAPADYIVGNEHEKNSRVTKVRKLVDGADVSGRKFGMYGEEFTQIQFSSIFGGSVNATNCNINVTISKK